MEQTDDPSFGSPPVAGVGMNLGRYKSYKKQPGNFLAIGTHETAPFR